MHFYTEKVVTCCVALFGQHDMRDSHDTFSGVVTAWTGVDISTSLFTEVVPPEIDVNPEHKRINLYTR